MSEHDEVQFSKEMNRRIDVNEQHDIDNRTNINDQQAKQDHRLDELESEE